MSASNRPTAAASAGHDQEPTVSRQRCPPSASTTPSPACRDTAAAGRSRTTSPRQGQSPRRRRGGGVAVVEAQHLARVHGGAQRGEHPAGDRGRRRLDGGDRERVEPAAQPGRHDLPDRGQRPRRRLPDAGAGARCRPQRDGQCDRLLVVEQQRRQVRPGAEPVPALGPLDGRDRVAQLPQPADVAAHRTGAGLEPLGQQRTRPVPAGLQQRQQRQQARGGLRHGCRNARRSGHSLSASAAIVIPCPSPTTRRIPP